MRSLPPDAMSRAHVQERLGFPGLAASNDHEPPAPLEIFTRLAALLAIALGLIIHITVRMSQGPRVSRRDQCKTSSRLSKVRTTPRCGARVGGAGVSTIRELRNTSPGGRI